MPCKHYKLAAIYAQQMAEMDEPWKLWQFNDGGSWTDCVCHLRWDDGKQYRQIPKTIKIGNFDVPEPMREKPAKGTEYYFITSSEKDGTRKDIWCGTEDEINRLNNGCCHLTRDNCILHAKALFSFSEVE